MVEEAPDNRPKRLYTTRNVEIDAKIQEIVHTLGTDEFDRQLMGELMASSYRLGQDGASTIDLKIINSAVKELRYAFKVFQPYRHVRKVAMFGSARTPSDRPAYQMAKEFGRLMTKAGWMMITGAASGIMWAGHEGAGREASFGLNIRLPFEQEANEVILNDPKLVTCKYFFTRKLLFLKESQATVLFPGGFGTLDEGFECLTLVQTGKATPRPIVFVDLPDGSFWKPLLQFMGEKLVKEGMVSPNDHFIYQIAHSAQEAVEIIQRFYRVYHSLRYVDGRLVMRLTQPLPEKLLGELSKEFRDILVGGEIVQGLALPEEENEQGDEPALKALSRLVFHFNRHDFGRLTQMINKINE